MTTSSIRLEAGVFADDPPALQQRARELVRERIVSRSPIFPARCLGLEYAVFTEGIPRGIPVASIALSNLRVGEAFVLNGGRYEVTSRGKSLTFSVRAAGGVRVVRIGPALLKWESFCRDVDGLLLAAAHGVDAGDLLRAWRRDPASRTNS